MSGRKFYFDLWIQIDVSEHDNSVPASYDIRDVTWFQSWRRKWLSRSTFRIYSQRDYQPNAFTQIVTVYFSGLLNFIRFPAFREFPPSFKVKEWFWFFSPTSCPPSPCLGLWPSRSKRCIFSWYKAIKSPENQSRHHAVHVTNFTAHNYKSQGRHKLGAGGFNCVGITGPHTKRVVMLLEWWSPGGGVGWKGEGVVQ